jgi:hypothetical protein
MAFNAVINGFNKKCYEIQQNIDTRDQAEDSEQKIILIYQA